MRAGEANPPSSTKTAMTTLHRGSGHGRGSVVRQGREQDHNQDPEFTSVKERLTSLCQRSFQSTQLRQRSGTQRDTSENQGLRSWSLEPSVVD